MLAKANLDDVAGHCKICEAFKDVQLALDHCLFKAPYTGIRMADFLRSTNKQGPLNNVHCISKHFWHMRITQTSIQDRMRLLQIRKKFCGILMVELFATLAMGLNVGAMVPTTKATIALGPYIMMVFVIFG